MWWAVQGLPKRLSRMLFSGYSKALFMTQSACSRPDNDFPRLYKRPLLNRAAQGCYEVVSRF